MGPLGRFYTEARRHGEASLSLFFLSVPLCFRVKSKSYLKRNIAQITPMKHEPVNDSKFWTHP